MFLKQRLRIACHIHLWSILKVVYGNEISDIYFLEAWNTCQTRP